jgi:uncharacterized membrane protein
MSLRAFHILFILASAALSALLSAWSFRAYRADGGASWLGLAAVGASALAALGAYLSWFLRKNPR